VPYSIVLYNCTSNSFLRPSAALSLTIILLLLFYLLSGGFGSSAFVTAESRSASVGAGT
jgi:hypothetical protein